MEDLELTKEWDKIFPKSYKVNHSKVTFRNRYGITLAADMYTPKNINGKMAAIAISGPFGAVKEQASGLYAQTMAERICGWGGMALNAATIDTRIKATVTSTMYDMSRVNANGYFDSMNADQRHELRRQLNEQRTIDTKNGSYALPGGVVDPLPDDVPWFVKDYHNYYKTDRGYHKRSLNSNGGWNKTSALSFINMPLLTYSDEIRSAVLMIHGEKAHSRYFSEDAFKKLTGDNKELLILPGANHVDLYDNLSVIPFDKIEHFFHKYLK